MDHAAASLKAITESGEYVRISDIPLFDQHEEWSKDGSIVRRFNKDRLEKICAYNNAREKNTGDLCKFGHGHTIDDAPETDQPPLWGFFRNWRVKDWKGKPTIFADQYWKKRVPDGKGGTISHEEARRNNPNRSIELWTRDPDGKPIDGYIDWVSVQRRTPARDLGLLAYSKGEVVKAPTDQLFASPRGRALSAAMRGSKLCYSMDSLETNMDPTLPADATAPDQAFIDKVKAALMSIPALAKLMEPAPVEPPMDAPGGDAPLPGGLDAPGGDDPLPPEKDDKIPFSKNPRSLQNRVEYLEKQNAALAAKLAEADKVREAEKLAFSKADAERHVDVLEREGVVLDRDYEVERFTKTELDKRDELATRIRRTHKTGHGRSLPPAGIFQVGDQPVAGKYSKDVCQKASAFAADPANKVTYEEALQRFSKQ